MPKTLATSTKSLFTTAVLSVAPATPAAGFSVIYAMTDGKWYIKNSDGTIAEITTPASLSSSNNLFNYYNFF